MAGIAQNRDAYFPDGAIRWDPWILIVGGVRALVVVGLLAVRQVFERPTETR